MKIILIVIFFSNFLFAQSSQEEITMEDFLNALKAMTEELENTVWKKGNYIDSFGDPTGGHFLSSKRFSGYFSDSIANGAELKVAIQVERRGRKNQKTDINFKLFKYGDRHYKSNIFPNYQIKIKHNGKTLKGNYRGFMHSNGLISLNNPTTFKVHEIFMEGGSVKFMLKNYESKSTFNFSIDDIDHVTYKKIFNKI